MTAEKIIKKYRLFVDDASELSEDEELDLAQDKYDELQGERTWSFLRKGFTSTISGAEIELPADFRYPIRMGNQDELTVRFVSTKGIRHIPVVDFSQRFDTYELSAYYDYTENKLKFTETISGDVFTDYIYEPTKLTGMDVETVGKDKLGTGIAALMARDFYSIDQTEQGRSKYEEYQVMYEKILDQMSTYDNYGLMSY